VKILYLAHRVPYPPNKGEKIRAFNELRHFSKKHEVHLAAFYDRPEDGSHAESLRSYCRDVLLVPLRPAQQMLRAAASMLKGQPWTLGYFHSPMMRRMVESKLKDIRFDAIFVYSSSMAQYVLHADGIPRILDFVDSDATKWGQYAGHKPAAVSWLYRSEHRRLAEFERAMAERFEASVFVAAREADHLVRNGGPADKLHFIQNGIDLDFFQPQAVADGPPAIVFTGAMDYFPNVDAVVFFSKQILPRIQARRADAHFVIVGSSPTAEVLGLEKLPGVRVTGGVKDIRPYLAGAAVSVVPLRISRGIQNKLLEALAMGVPVVATSNAADSIRGLESLPVTVANSPEEFAEGVLRSLDRRLTPEEIEQCRSHLGKYYNWEVNLESFERLLEKVTGSGCVCSGTGATHD
jgi:polysaccharide biosynthesis protein PslH